MTDKIPVNLDRPRPGVAVEVDGYMKRVLGAVPYADRWWNMGYDFWSRTYHTTPESGARVSYVVVWITSMASFGVFEQIAEGLSNEKLERLHPR